MRNKILSSIKTGAICDALGYPVEFKKNPEVEIPEELLFTDDTQMTLFVMEGLTKGNVKQAMIEWYYTQEHKSSNYTLCWFGKDPRMQQEMAPGNTCMSSLQDIEEFSKRPLNNSKGNGALIRSAAFGMASKNPEVAFKEAFDHSFLTHDHFLSAISCGSFAMLICNMLYRGLTLKEAVIDTINYLDELDSDDYSEVNNILYDAIDLVENINTTNPHRYFGEGWVAEEALGIAVYSALLYEKTGDFESSIKYAIYHDGDSDSTGSIFGNLVGLMIGDVEKVDELLKNTFNISIHDIDCEDIIDKVVDDFCKNVCHF